MQQFRFAWIAAAGIGLGCSAQESSSEPNPDPPETVAIDMGATDLALVDRGVVDGAIDAEPTPEPDASVSTETRMIPGPNGDLAIRVTGVGAVPAITVHGGPGLSHFHMRGFELMAEPTRQVVSYDQRGCGDSAVPDNGRYEFRDHFADLEAVREAVGAEQIDLIGSSWGGGLAAYYAAAYPQRVRRMVLIGPVAPSAAGLDAANGRFFECVARLQAQGLIEDPLPPEPVAAQWAIWPCYFGDPSKQPDWLEDESYNFEVGLATRAACQPPGYDWTPTLGGSRQKPWWSLAIEIRLASRCRARCSTPCRATWPSGRSSRAPVTGRGWNAARRPWA